MLAFCVAVSLLVPAIQHVLSKNVQYTDKSGGKDIDKGKQIFRHGHEADDGRICLLEGCTHSCQRYRWIETILVTIAPWSP